jgi:cytoskeletal protein CcmA (bactofilin family)
MLSGMASITVVARGSLLEGRIVSDGEVIVEEGAEVRAEVRARRVIVRGIIRGDVIATEVRLEEGGRIIGGLRTPAAEAAVAVAAAASRPNSTRSPMAPGIADEIAEAVALDATRELTGDLELTPAPSPLAEGGRDPHSPPTGAVSPAGAGGTTDPSRRVVAVRRKG